MRSKYFAHLAVLAVLCSCNASVPGTSSAIGKTGMAANGQNTVIAPADTAKKEKPGRIAVANETDPVCGMPTLRGSEDTVMYKGKIIGFCSKECKDEFVKKPRAYKIKYK